jgi:hypothetical protein
MGSLLVGSLTALFAIATVEAMFNLEGSMNLTSERAMVIFAL